MIIISNYYMLLRGGYKHTLTRLLSSPPHGFNINGQYSDTTLLHIAAAIGNAHAVRGLLKHGADRKITNKLGNTPLEVANKHARHEVAELLLDARLSANAPVEKPTTTKGSMAAIALFRKNNGGRLHR